jgi:hypothetical protein
MVMAWHVFESTIFQLRQAPFPSLYRHDRLGTDAVCLRHALGTLKALTQKQTRFKFSSKPISYRKRPAAAAARSLEPQGLDNLLRQ